VRAHFILYVRDQARSAAFYRAALGRESTLDVPGMTEIPLNDGAILGLMPEAGIQRLLGISPPRGDARAELYLHVDDVETAMKRAVDAGARVLSAIAERDWGDRVGYVADPDGHVIGFATRSRPPE
jgi:uncharacterized protein